MFKKTLSIAASATLLCALSLPITPNAGAYREICLRLEVPKAWYAAKFRVEYGDPQKLWGAYFINEVKSTNKSSIEFWERSGHLARARGRTQWSPLLAVLPGKPRSYCFPMSQVRHGEHFAVLMRMEEAEGVSLRYCRGWEPGKALVFQQNANDNTRLTIKAWGTVFAPECAAERRE